MPTQPRSSRSSQQRPPRDATVDQPTTPQPAPTAATTPHDRVTTHAERLLEIHTVRDLARMASSYYGPDYDRAWQTDPATLARKVAEVQIARRG